MARVLSPEEYLNETSNNFNELNFIGMQDKAKQQQERADASFFSEIVPAAFQMANSAVSAVSFGGKVSDSSKTVTEFGLSQKLFDKGFRNEEIYIEAVDRNINTPEELEEYTDGIRTQRENMEIFRANPVSGSIAMLAAGALDPVNFIPGAGVLMKARRLGNLAKGAISGAAVGSLTEGTSQAIIASDQVTQGYDTVLPAALLGGALGGILGGGAGVLQGIGESSSQAANRVVSSALDLGPRDRFRVDASVEYTDVTKGGQAITTNIGSKANLEEVKARADELEDRGLSSPEIESHIRKEFADMDNQNSSAGAAEASPATRIAAEEELKKDEAFRGNLAKWLNKATTFGGDANSKYVGWMKHLRSPAVNMATATSLAIRRGTNKIIESAGIQSKNSEGFTDGVALQRKMQNDFVAFRDLQRDMKRAYTKYTQAGGPGDSVKAIQSKIKANRGEKLGYADFNEEIHRAVAVKGGNHEIPEVQDIAKRIIRKKNEFYDKLVEKGLVSEGDIGRTAVEHITRVWDRKVVMKDTAGFKKLLEDNYETHLGGTRENRKAVQDDLDRDVDSVRKDKDFKESLDLPRLVRTESIPKNLAEIDPEAAKNLEDLAARKKDLNALMDSFITMPKTLKGETALEIKEVNSIISDLRRVAISGGPKAFMNRIRNLGIEESEELSRALELAKVSNRNLDEAKTVTVKVSRLRKEAAKAKEAAEETTSPVTRQKKKEIEEELRKDITAAEKEAKNLVVKEITKLNKTLRGLRAKDSKKFESVFKDLKREFNKTTTELERARKDIRLDLKKRLGEVNKRIEKTNQFIRQRRETLKELDDELNTHPSAWSDGIIKAITSDLTNQSTMDAAELTSVVGASALNRARTVRIPDSTLIGAKNFRGENFLSSNMEDNVGAYLRNASQALRSQETLDDLGYNSFADYRAEIAEDFARRRKNLEDLSKSDSKIADKQDKLLERLVDEERFWNGKGVEDIGELARIFNAATGRIGKIRGPVDKSLKHLRQATTMAFLGGITLSSIPDLSMHAFKNGPLNTFKDGLLPMLRGFKTAKMEADKLQDFGVAVEFSMSELLRITEGGSFNNMSNRGRIDLGFDTALDAFGKVTMMEYWNRFNRRLAARTTSATMLRAADKLARTGNIKQIEMERFASLGLTKSDLKDINTAFQKYGQKKDGTFAIDYEKWDLDPALKDSREKFSSAVAREVDSTIILPGAGDIPTAFQDRQVLKTLFQFKSFSSAAYNKIVLNGATRRLSDANIYHILTTMPILGTVSWAVKQKLRGNEEDLPDDWAGWVDKVGTEGFARSGVTTLYGDAALTMYSGLGFGGSDRWATKSLTNFFLGPSFSLLTNAVESANALNGDDELTESEQEKLTRIMPFNVLRQYFKNTAEIFGDN